MKVLMYSQHCGCPEAGGDDSRRCVDVWLKVAFARGNPMLYELAHRYHGGMSHPRSEYCAGADPFLTVYAPSNAHDDGVKLRLSGKVYWQFCSAIKPGIPQVNVVRESPAVVCLNHYPNTMNCAKLLAALFTIVTCDYD